MIAPGEQRQPQDGPGKTACWAVIPARSGSRGVARKCLRRVGRQTLLARAVRSCNGAETVDRTFVSTDDTAFADEARAHGAEVPGLRPAALARDHIATTDVVVHMLDTITRDGTPPPAFILLVQPTTPLLHSGDIDAAFRLFTPDVDAVVSVCRTEVNPDWLRRTDAHGYLQSIATLDCPQHTPRQQMPPTWRLNGGIYWVRTAVFCDQATLLPARAVPYVMPAERSVDIDSEDDLALAAWRLQRMERATANRRPAPTEAPMDPT